MNKSNIISLSDILTQKIMKEEELRKYDLQLKELQTKAFFLTKEIQMLEYICSAVRDEISPKEFIKGILEAELSKLEDK